MKDVAITPVTLPTAWCTPMVVVLKPSGALRISVDYTDLNNSELREWRAITAVEHAHGVFRGAAWF